MLRETAQRRIIRNIFENTKQPLKADDVLRQAQKKLPNLGIATVYRNIKILFDQGWLVKVEIGKGSTMYERSDLDHHHHFLCNKCESVFDLPGCAKSLRHLVPSNFKLLEHDLTLFGICPDCSN